jgi:hypothetical protein
MSKNVHPIDRTIHQSTEHTKRRKVQYPTQQRKEPPHYTQISNETNKVSPHIHLCKKKKSTTYTDRIRTNRKVLTEKEM